MTQPAVPPGSAVTTPEQMLAEIRAMHNELTTLNATINPAFNEIRADVADNKTEIERLAARVSTLEKWRYQVAGGAIVIGAAAGWAAQFLGH